VGNRKWSHTHFLLGTGRTQKKKYCTYSANLLLFAEWRPDYIPPATSSVSTDDNLPLVEGSQQSQGAGPPAWEATPVTITTTSTTTTTTTSKPPGSGKDEDEEQGDGSAMVTQDDGSAMVIQGDSSAMVTQGDGSARLTQGDRQGDGQAESTVSDHFESAVSSPSSDYLVRNNSMSSLIGWCGARRSVCVCTGDGYTYQSPRSVTFGQVLI
jgi:hypothetical protein